MRYKILLLVVGLDVGGTETHVLELATRLDRRRFDVTVCSLKGRGRVGLELERRGVRVVALDGCGKGDARILFRLWGLVRRERPHVIHAFLFRANLVARLIGRAAPGSPGEPPPPIDCQTFRMCALFALLRPVSYPASPQTDKVCGHRTGVRAS